MKIATWNVNGIRARHEQVAEWMQREQPDVVCLQELKASIEQLPAGLAEVEGYWCHWHGEKGYSGVALLVRKQPGVAPPRVMHPSFDFEHRIVEAQIGSLTIASIYVPNGGKDFEAKTRFLEALLKHAAELGGAGRDIVLCGDFNVARAEIDVHPKERKPRAIGQLPEERAMFDRLLSENLVDVGRALDPDNEGLFTWWAPWRNLRQRNIGWRLDYVLASGPLAGRAASCVVGHTVGTSDHAPVIATFENPGTQPLLGSSDA